MCDFWRWPLSRKLEASTMITRRRSTCQRERARVKPWKVRRHLDRLCLGWETWLEHAGTWRMSLLVSLCGSSFPILGPVFPLFSQKLRGASNAWTIFWEAQKAVSHCKFEFKLLIFPFEQFQESRCSNNLLDGFCQCFLNCCMLEISRKSSLKISGLPFHRQRQRKGQGQRKSHGRRWLRADSQLRLRAAHLEDGPQDW